MRASALLWAEAFCFMGKVESVPGIGNVRPRAGYDTICLEAIRYCVPDRLAFEDFSPSYLFLT